MSKLMPKKLIMMLSLTCACFVGCGPKTVEERAEAGDAGAQARLGYMYFTGEWMTGPSSNWGKQGAPQDAKEAFKWYRLAADQGLADAQCALGEMYEKGKGVPQDYVQAYAWYSLAVRGNYPEMIMDHLPEEMTPEQIARAQELSTELDKKIYGAK